MHNIKNQAAVQRSMSADVVRVTALLMIVALHTILNFTVRPDFFATKVWFLFEPLVVLSKAGIPLFFMLSGYLVINKNRTIKDNLYKTIKRILIPLCFFTIINIIIASFKFDYAGSDLAAFWQGQLIRVTNFPSSWLWFLVVLAFLYLLNPVWQLIFTNEKNKKIAIYILVLTFLFSIFATFIKFPSLKNETLYNNFTGWLGYVFFYLYGGVIRNNWFNIKYRNNILLIIIGFVMVAVGDFYTSYAKINNIEFIWSGYFFDYLSLPNVLLSLGLFNILIMSDYSALNSNILGKRLYATITWLAGLSFGIYLIHSYVVSFFTDVIAFDFDHLGINVYLYNFLNYFLVLGISTIIVFLIRKTPKLRAVIGE